MLLTVTYGTASGDSAQVDVEPEATPMDVLQAMKEANALGIDPSKERYVVSIPRLGKDLTANQRLADAGIREGDLVTVDRSETGYQAAIPRSRSR